jgi:hypothetical protein
VCVALCCVVVRRVGGGGLHHPQVLWQQLPAKAEGAVGGMCVCWGGGGVRYGAASAVPIDVSLSALMYVWRQIIAFTSSRVVVWPGLTLLAARFSLDAILNGLALAGIC